MIVETSLGFSLWQRLLSLIRIFKALIRIKLKVLIPLKLEPQRLKWGAKKKEVLSFRSNSSRTQLDGKKATEVFSSVIYLNTTRQMERELFSQDKVGKTIKICKIHIMNGNVLKA
mmetsp:Transcript_5470/g.6011  ORF Transcript_5470/g.6011 Transcript_5470/m.6011 type:complete len:115 (-) Transcript_5470:912-1256(-)